MPSPFPGMDPYLEHPALWPGLHNLLIAALDFDLAPRLRPRYYVAVEERVYITAPLAPQFVGVPDVTVVGARPLAGGSDGGAVWGSAVPSSHDPAVGVLDVALPAPEQIREVYLEVRTPGSHDVITVIELLSPGNKRPGEGRRQYEEKRAQALRTRTSLVEIDLLRHGEPMPVWLGGQPVTVGLPGDYRIVISPGHRRPSANLYHFTVRDPLPRFPLPLRPDDEPITVDLRSALDTIYDRGAFDLRFDYRQEPMPPLRPEDAAWAGDLLRQKNLR